MTFATRMAHIVGIFLFGVLSLAHAADQPEGTPIKLNKATFHGAVQSLGLETAANNRLVRGITFKAAEEWPGMSLAAQKPWDWSKAGAVLIDLTNREDRPVEFHLRIDDDAKADGIHHCRTASGTIAAKASAKFAVSFGPDPMSVGVRGLPVRAGLKALNLGGQDKLDSTHIVGFTFFLHQPEEDTTLVINAMRVLPPVDMKGCIDRFGQYANADWPGKVHDEKELAAQRELEASDLTAHPTMPDRDRFGGWASGPKQPATGFFRVEKVNGKWWLVDPAGALFFSSGVDCVGEQDGTVITGREDWFSWLPKPGDPLAKFFGRVNNIHSGPVKEGRIYDFLKANLVRKYSGDFESRAHEMALKRLPAWGFNTIANWSDSRFYKNGKVPYTATGGVNGDHARLASGSDYWGKMHDPFDPKFADDVKLSLEPLIAQVKGDPWCVGYFVDNELSWGSFDLKDKKGRLGLALGALAADAKQPAKAAFVKMLQKKYDSIAKLNDAWGTSFASWDALATQSYKPESLDKPALQADLSMFVLEHARTYFKTIADYLHEQDPDHLYLGCRFAWKTREAIQAADETCDVVSFNIYDRQVDPQKWSVLTELKKPAIIGEFHVGALDRGMWHTGLQSAADQKERAQVFHDYVASVLENPTLVGCHWFKYGDEPVTGRTYDGENYNIGLLSVTDTPYPELIEAAKQVHRDMYERRAK